MMEFELMDMVSWFFGVIAPAATGLVGIFYPTRNNSGKLKKKSSIVLASIIVIAAIAGYITTVNKTHQENKKHRVIVKNLTKAIDKISIVDNITQQINEISQLDLNKTIELTKNVNTISRIADSIKVDTNSFKSDLNIINKEQIKTIQAKYKLINEALDGTKSSIDSLTGTVTVLNKATKQSFTEMKFELLTINPLKLIKGKGTEIPRSNLWIELTQVGSKFGEDVDLRITQKGVKQVILKKENVLIKSHITFLHNNMTYNIKIVSACSNKSKNQKCTNGPKKHEEAVVQISRRDILYK